MPFIKKIRGLPWKLSEDNRGSCLQPVFTPNSDFFILILISLFFFKSPFNNPSYTTPIND